MSRFKEMYNQLKTTSGVKVAYERYLESSTDANGDLDLESDNGELYVPYEYYERFVTDYLDEAWEEMEADHISDTNKKSYEKEMRAVLESQETEDIVGEVNAEWIDATMDNIDFYNEANAIWERR